MGTISNQPLKKRPGINDNFALDDVTSGSGKRSTFEDLRRGFSGFTVPTIADLKAEDTTRFTDNDKVLVLGYSSVGDGGGGFVYYDSSLISFNDGTTFAADDGNGGWKRTDKVYVDIKEFGAKGDGVTDDTNNLQNAIDYVSNKGGTLRGEKGKVYITDTLFAKSNVKIDLNGSTLKLKDNTNERIFFGSNGGENFHLLNGVLDGNKTNNTGDLIHSGGSNFTDWNKIRFENLEFNNIYRAALILDGTTKNVILKNISNNNGGQSNAFGRFGYALETWPGVSNVLIDNFSVSNMHGFGIHFQCSDFVANDLTFDTLTFGGSAIAITFTEASRGSLSNIDCTNVDGDNIEINASQDITINNIEIDSAGDIPLIIGDNGTGIFNERLEVKNLKTSLTGGMFSGRFNFIKNCRFEYLDFDKTIDTSTTGDPADDRDIALINSKIDQDISLSFTRYQKFILEDVSFSNFYIHHHSGPISTFSCPRISGQYFIDIITGASTFIDLKAFNDLLLSGVVNGRLRVTSLFNNQQSSYQECLFLASNNDTTLNLSAVTQVDNATPRPVTITADAANNRIELANSTGVDLKVWWTVELHKADR